MRTFSAQGWAADARPALAAGMLCGLLAAGCPPDGKGAAEPRPLAAIRPPGSAVSLGDKPLRRFSFTTVDGSRVTSDALRGRLTVVAFGATYDPATQVQARFLSAIARSHVPRTNVLLVMLEPAPHRPLVEAFASTLNLPFPVVMADPAAPARGPGPFAEVRSVPAMLLLDHDSREVWRHLGVVSEPELHEVLRSHEKRAD